MKKKGQKIENEIKNENENEINSFLILPKD